MKKMIIKFIFLTTLILVTIGTLNFFIDKGNILKTESYYNKICDNIINDIPIKGLSNGDQVILKKNLFKKVNEINDNFDILVFGSSRAWNLNSEVFNGNRIFNFSIPNNRLRDTYAYINFALKHSKKPKKIYIELYPDMFYKGNEKLLYNFLIRDYIEISKKYGIKNSDNSFKSQIVNHPIYNIFSPSYFQFSLFFLINRNIFIPTENLNMDFSLYELKKDGSFIPPQSTKDKDGIDFRPFIKKSVLKFKNIEYNIETFDELEKLILIINSLNINLNIVLSPLHPFIYDLCMENPGFEYILEIEEKIRKICNKNNISVFGSYNPKATNAKAEDFYDQVHLKHEKTSKIFNF